VKDFLIKIDKKFFFSFFINFYKSFSLNITTKNLNKSYENRSTHYYSQKKINLISELCVKHGSDKGYVDFNIQTPYFWRPRNYSEFYFKMFHHCREHFKLVFECGLGTNNINIPSNMTSGGKPGASLKVWRDYFVNAEIFGADIDKEILFNSERIKTFEVDQTNKESIKNMWNKINLENFDLIIDDGLHNYEAGITLFKNSFDKLKKDGIYIIEDVSNKYLEHLIDDLKEFNPEVVILNSRLNIRTDNNLICFRKY